MIPKSQWRILLVWSILQQRSKSTEIILKTTSWFQYVYINITSIINIYLLLLLSLLSLSLLLLYIIYIYIIAILLYDIILLYYTVLHCIILYYVILCYIILYYIILCYIMLYYVILCYIMLYYTINIYIYTHYIYTYIILYYNSSLVDSNISSFFRSSQLAQAPDQHHSRSPSLHRSPGTAWLEGCWSSSTNNGSIIGYNGENVANSWEYHWI